MSAIKIAIIGDFNFAYNAHHATNLSLDHSSNFLEEEINYYWIRPSELLSFKKNSLEVLFLRTIRQSIIILNINVEMVFGEII